MEKHNYITEPELNSELILVNNAKKLKKNPKLLNEEHLDRIYDLREEYVKLDREGSNQKEKRKIRDELRELSAVTYTNRDTNLFGEMITRMVEGIVSRPQFSNYTFKDDMKSLGIQYVLLYTHAFDPFKKSEITGQYVSAFAYISTVLFSGCIATINKFTKEQQKAKEDFLEHQKLFHRDPNKSTIGPDFEDASRKIHLPNLENKENTLLSIMKSSTITEATEFWIPVDYKISQKEYDFTQKYIHNISIRRIK